MGCRLQQAPAAFEPSLPDPRGLCRHPHRNGRPAEQPRPAPPFARCISPRRVRQLVAEGILPGSDEAGTYDVQRCADRHALFLARHDAAAWSGFDEQLVRDTRRVERLLAAALRTAASGPQLRAASLAVQRLFADLSFMTRCRSKTPAERDLFLGLWREREDHASASSSRRRPRCSPSYHPIARRSALSVLQ